VTHAEGGNAAKVWAIVPAAGVGSRMGAECPKQYLPLAGQTIIEKTFERLLALPIIERLVVAVNPLDDRWQDMALAQHQKVVAVAGGKERADSVLNGLLSLQPFAAATDWVLVHDAARPCVDIGAVKNLLRECHGSNVGGILGVPVSDTIKRVNADSVIAQTIDRSSLWQAQTPQLFRYGVLLQALQRSLAAGYVVTDEASAVEFMGLAAIMVAGSSDNIKITRPEDLPLAEMIIKRQEMDG
jgi:2-C-methyl-D-erythritol 4-phosphate cytidylyltransferase|tara:strand:+ start:1340 stop:2065 length:726 start_codon:yes stop_codon:yes gene_type:complete